MRSRHLPLTAVALIAAPAAAQDIAVKPLFGTQLRYEQSSADTLLGVQDAFLFRARPGIDLSGGDWSIEAVSDASVAVRRETQPSSALNSSTPMRPDGFALRELQLRYHGLPATEISVGRQRLEMAGAAITGDRDGEQTFDAARLKWRGIRGVSADLAYAWASTTSFAAAEAVLPAKVEGDNIFAQINWQNALGTLSGYAYQVDQRHAAASDFRLLNQVYGARLAGKRKLSQDVQLNYTLGYMRQTGSLANAAATNAPTYWLMGSNFDFGDLSGSSVNYRRFAANGISTMNGNQLNLATSATNGKITVGAAFNAFRPLPETNAISTRDVRVSLGLVF